MTEPLISEERINALAATVSRNFRHREAAKEAIRTAVMEAGEAAAKVCDGKAREIDDGNTWPNRECEYCAEEIRRRLP